MKGIKYLILILALLVSCEQENNTLEDITFRGGYVKFSEAPNLSFNILKLDTEVFTATLQDPNKNATSYTLNAIYKEGEAIAENLVEINSFPYTLELYIEEVIEALGITEDEIDLTDRITFVATVTCLLYTSPSPRD